MPQPPQSAWHWQVQLFGSAWYVGPQLSAAVSQTQPHTEPEFSKRKPGAQVAFCLHSQPQVVELHVWYALQVPPQSLVHTKSQTSLLVSQTLPAGGVLVAHVADWESGPVVVAVETHLLRVHV